MPTFLLAIDPSGEGHLRTVEKVLGGKDMVSCLQELGYPQKQVADKLEIEPGLEPKGGF